MRKPRPETLNNLSSHKGGKEMNIYLNPDNLLPKLGYVKHCAILPLVWEYK